MADRLAKQQGIWPELRAGITVGVSALTGFLIVPLLLFQLGMDFAGAYTAFAMASIAGTLLMGFLRLPLLLMPSAAISSSLVYLVGISQGISWQQLLGISFTAALVGMLLFLSPWGKKIYDAVPPIIHELLPAAFGTMLIMLGLTQGRIVVRSAWSVTMLGNFQDPLAYWGLTGILLTIGMLAMKIRGALFYGFVLTAILALAEGFWVIPASPFMLPGGMELTAGQLTLTAAIEKSLGQMTIAGISLFFMMSCVNWSCIRALGTEGRQAGRPTAAVFGIGMFGALLGSLPPVASPLSAAGVMSGGRGRWTAVGAAAVLFAALFCEPIVQSMSDFPVMAVPVLVGAGLLLLQETAERIREEDFRWEIPEFSAAVSLLLVMPLSGNFTAGLGTAIVSWCFLTAVRGEWRRVSRSAWLLTMCFVMYFVFAEI